jgi:hypothetical protein
MAEADRQLNYWFGNPNLETQISMPGGGFGRASPVRPSVPANDPAMVNVQRAPNYDAALRQQQILNASKDAHIGDIDYWQKIADQEGHRIGSFTNPYKAAKETSRNGQPTILIDPDGRRVLYQNGQRVVERFSDMPK